MGKPAKPTEFWKLFTRLRGKTPQRQVALQIGVSTQAIQGWKHGAAPKLDTRKALAKLFRVPLSVILVDEDDDALREAAAISDAVGVIGSLRLFAIAMNAEDNLVQSWIDGHAVPSEIQRRRIGAILRALEDKNFHDARSGGEVVTDDAVRSVLEEYGVVDPVERLYAAKLIELRGLQEPDARRLLEALRPPKHSKERS